MPSVGRLNTSDHIGVDVTLSSCVKAIVVTTGTRTAYWFKVGGIEPCELCVSSCVFLLKIKNGAAQSCVPHKFSLSVARDASEFHVLVVHWRMSLG